MGDADGKIKGPKGSGGFGLKMPKIKGPNWKFGGGAGGDVDLPEGDVSGDVDIGGKVDLPDADVKVEAPSVDIGAGAKADLPDADLKVGGGADVDADLNLK